MSDGFLKIYNGTNYVPRAADPLNPIDGDIQFADGTARPKGLWEYKDTKWQQVGGGGGGGLDTFHSDNFETTSTSDATSGNNATYLTAGTFSGTLSDETVNPISKDRSGKYTAHATTPVINDWFDFTNDNLVLSDKQKGTNIGINFWVDANSFSTDFEFVVWDVTNGEKLTSVLPAPEGDVVVGGTERTRYSTSVFIPLTCNEISYGFHMTTLPIAGESFIFDDIEFSTNPFVFKDILEPSFFSEKFLSVSTSASGDLTDLTVTGLVVGKQYLITGVIYLSSFSATENTVTFRSGSGGTGTVYGDHIFGNNNLVSITKGGSLSIKFTASSNTLYLNKSGPNNIFGNGSKSQSTFIQVSLDREPTSSVISPINAKANHAVIKLAGGNGKGSTATRVSRFDTFAGSIGGVQSSFVGTSQNFGSIVALDDAANGTSVTVQKDGWYSFTYSAEASDGSDQAGLSINQFSALTTNPYNLDEREVLALGRTNAAGTTDVVSWSGPLKAGDVVRPVLGAGTNVSAITYLIICELSFEGLILSAIPSERYSKHSLTSGDISSLGTTSISSLTFNNLIVGKWYRIHTHAEGILLNGADRDMRFFAEHNSVSMANIQIAADNSANAVPYALSAEQTFKATTTTVTFKTIQNGSAAPTLYGTAGETFVELFEHQHFSQTTSFD